MKTQTIRQTVTFKVTPHEVYEALMDSKRHSQFSGSKAEVSRKVGGEFSAYGGGLNGTNLELVGDKKIVQLWRCEMQGWPSNYYSKTTFSFSKTKTGTKLVFVQTGVPEECFKSISEGWHDYYWKPMRQILEG